MTSDANSGPFIPFYTSDFLGGTGGMTAAQKGVYITLICMIYENEGPIPEPYSALARRCGCTFPSFKNALDELCSMGKLEVVDDGIWCDKCEKHLSRRRKRTQRAKESANARWEKIQQKQSPADANALQSDMRSQCYPEPEPEPVNTSPYGDGANAPQDSDSVKTGRTDKDRIFALVSQLVVMTGDRESAVRSRIGLLRKSNDDAAILAALVAGIEGGVAHPLDYATRILSDEKTKSDYGNPEYWEKHFANQ